MLPTAGWERSCEQTHALDLVAPSGPRDMFISFEVGRTGQWPCLTKLALRWATDSFRNTAASLMCESMLVSHHQSLHAHVDVCHECHREGEDVREDDAAVLRSRRSELLMISPRDIAVLLQSQALAARHLMKV